MNIKVEICDNDKFKKRVKLTGPKEYFKRSNKLHDFLVLEGFVSNYEDIRCLDSYSHDEENVTHVFRIRWVPEKWAEKKPVIKETPSEPKLKQRRQKNKPLNLQKLEKDIDKKFDENKKDV
jgi:hypothetical protein